MESLDDRQVITRTGTIEAFDVDQISHRIDRLINRTPSLPHIKRNDLIMQVCRGLPSGLLKTSNIDDECARIASDMCVRAPQFLDLAARILIDNHQKNTARSFTDKMRRAYTRKDLNGKIFPLINKKFYKYVVEHQDRIEPLIDYQRDFTLSYFGMRTFLKIYGLRIDEHVIERPQDMFMRVAISLYMDQAFDRLIERRAHGLIEEAEWPELCAKAIDADIEQIKLCYETLSDLRYTHATPTYFNAGSCSQQLSSCFLLSIEDSLEGIKSVSTDITQISKMGGGIGLHLHRVRGADSLIRGTNGRSSGAIPFLKIYNEDMRAFNQGGRRMGSAAVYMAVHHPDIEQFIQLRVPGGIDEHRARDLFPAVWISDLFMERARDGGNWSLFNPDDKRVGPLSELYGRAFRERYEALERAGLACRTVKARDLLQLMFEANKRTGTPFLMFSDAVNRCSMQNNIGCIESSNLCTEITLYSDANESAVCNLTSTNLAKFVDTTSAGGASPSYDYARLMESVCQQVRNLNQVIDRNRYPTVRTHRSNLKHRPIGIGVQGYADALCMLGIPYDSEQAADFNKRVFETIYFAACSESCKVARDTWRAANSIFSARKFYVKPIIDYDETRVHLANQLEIQALNYAYEVYYDCSTLDAAQVQALATVQIDLHRLRLIEQFVEQANKRDFEQWSDTSTGSCPVIPAVYRANKVIKTESAVTYVKRILEQYPPNIYYHDVTTLPKSLGAYQSIGYIQNRPPSYYTADQLAELEKFIAYQSDGTQTYTTSHASAGRFHWELYPGVAPLCGYDWESLREMRKIFGQANSTLVALMPTATTSQFLGNCESFEPFTSNCYKRQTIAGEFIMFNKHLVAECYKMKLWNRDLCNNLILAEGSIQHITEIPAEIRALYKIARDIDQLVIIKQAADRQPYVDQAQSLNLSWVPAEITLKRFVTLINAAWKAGLKTGKYYFRSLPAAMPQPFTIDPATQQNIVAELERRRANERDNGDIVARTVPDCLVCSS